MATTDLIPAASGVSANGATPTVGAQQLTITPDLAKQWLEANTHNRPLKPWVVEHLAAAITRGEWAFNGDTIRFDSGGVLLDGQHRLAACIAAGKPIVSLVVFGLEPEAQQTIDLGRRRTFGDLLVLNGEPSACANSLAGAVVWLYREQTGKWQSRTDYPSHAQQLAILDANPGLRDAIGGASKLKKSAMRYPMSAAIYAHYRLGSIDRQGATWFCDRLVDGANLPEGHPILVLRGVVTRDLIARSRMPAPRLLALTFKAWNAYRDGKSVALLRWSDRPPVSEAFPIPR